MFLLQTFSRQGSSLKSVSLVRKIIRGFVISKSYVKYESTCERVTNYEKPHGRKFVSRDEIWDPCESGTAAVFPSNMSDLFKVFKKKEISWNMQLQSYVGSA